MSGKTLLFILIIVLLVFIWVKLNFKRLKVPSVCLITGGVKTGKSLLSVNLALKDYRRRHLSWWFATHIFRKKLEEPLFYTNVNISFGRIGAKKKHRLDKNIKPVEKEHLTREKRFSYKSVIYIQECSLTADNMLFNDSDLNIDLSLFSKLVAHETRGGILYLDTQSILDSHYSFKRVSSTYIFIQKNINLLLFHVLYLREMINTENGVNNFNEDTDFTMRKVIIPFWYHYKYDRYEFSYLTDKLNKGSLPYVVHNGIVSFNKRYEERGNRHL